MESNGSFWIGGGLHGYDTAASNWQLGYVTRLSLVDSSISGGAHEAPKIATALKCMDAGYLWFFAAGGLGAWDYYHSWQHIRLSAGGSGYGYNTGWECLIDTQVWSVKGGSPYREYCWYNNPVGLGAYQGLSLCRRLRYWQYSVSTRRRIMRDIAHLVL